MASALFSTHEAAFCRNVQAASGLPMVAASASSCCMRSLHAACQLQGRSYGEHESFGQWRLCCFRLMKQLSAETFRRANRLPMVAATASSCCMRSLHAACQLQGRSCGEHESFGQWRLCCFRLMKQLSAETFRRANRLPMVAATASSCCMRSLHAACQLQGRSYGEHETLGRRRLRWFRLMKQLSDETFKQAFRQPMMAGTASGPCIKPSHAACKL